MEGKHSQRFCSVSAGECDFAKSGTVTHPAPHRLTLPTLLCNVQLYLHQLLDTSGSSNQPPPGVLRVLRSKACRSAIMFGDVLGLQQCKDLVQQLAATELCFLCAHGRYVTVAVGEVGCAGWCLLVCYASSKACRSAVMFDGALDVQHAETLCSSWPPLSCASCARTQVCCGSYVLSSWARQFNRVRVFCQT